MREINTTKLLVIAILGFCAIILGSAVLTLQLFVTQEKRRLGVLGIRYNTNKKNLAQQPTTTTPPYPGKTTAAAAATVVTTIKPSQPISSKDLHLNQKSPPNGRNPHTIQQAFWRQAAIFLQKWDVLLLPSGGGSVANNNHEDYYFLYSDDDEEDEDGRSTDEPPLLIPPHMGSSSSSSSPSSSFLALWALQQAAQAGHPMAQHYVANAYASGIWPIHLEDNNNHNNNDKKKNDASAQDNNVHHGENGINYTLHVFDEWSASAIGSHSQLNKAFIYWHMASIGGNIEAAMALAHRISDLHQQDKEEKCQAVLPYLEAAAHGIMDQLEASPHSRAKVRPPMDKHMLPQVHMHGGTSSQLDWNNKPDESKEAIQFYHLKATQAPWSSRLAPSNPDEPSVDLTAAVTLAQLYHSGDRGVPQNLTKALLYYEIAANHGHWESAGPAGTFYLWGIGTTQNVIQAWKFFRIGAPYDLEGCQKMWERSLVTKQDHSNNCDHTSVNGLGVLHLLGIPGHLPVDAPRAEKFFTLAKEMGNSDAMYNLAMMWLGWKTHFKHVQDLQSDGMSSVDPLEAFAATTDSSGSSSSSKSSSSFALHYSERTKTTHKGPAATEVKEAHKLLGIAASKGHLQAKHRLAMMFSEGVYIQTNTIRHVVIKPSCEQAALQYQWIAENANLQLSKRLRKAYKAYIDGKIDVALRNYLAAAETGSSVGQVNAAFLLERGHCLGLSSTDCAKASVRLWKAAASRGIIEASLRVGDFYYYGRLRGKKVFIGPFAWVQYLLFPENHLPEILSRWSTMALQKIQNHFPWLGLKSYQEENDDHDQTATTEESDSTKAERIQRDRELLEADISTAAQYYIEAAEKYYSPRAHFNLGFMYEWGLGLKQDFPLAKRHYDLAATNNKKEAEVAVQLALWAMSFHQFVVKLRLSWDQRNRKARVNDTEKAPKVTDSRSPHELSPSMSGSVNRLLNKTAKEIILSHIFNWSSLAILILLYILVRLQKMRDDRRRR